MARQTLRAATAGLIFCYRALAQPAPAALQFEASDVHRSTSATNPQTYRSGGFLRGERYDLRKATIMDLIRLAWGFEPDRVFGGPTWLELDRFDIAGKAPASTMPQQIQLMLQNLLAERFKLVLHQDERPMSVFALRVGKGPKMKEATGSADPECKYEPQPSGSPYIVYACRNMTMAGFAQQIRGMDGVYLADPVVNSTGLKGSWDFDLKWMSRSRVLPGDMERTTIFSAVDQQLGLKLLAEQVVAPALVIDQVREEPTPNAPNIAEFLPSRVLQFEVASVKQSRPDVHDGYMGGTAGGGIEARGETMRNLFATAWDVHWDHVDEMIAGAPKWMDTARYDIQAKPPADVNGPAPQRTSFVDDDLRLMLRALLIGRFNIRTHYENRPVEAYTLVATRPRLKKADPGHRPNCKEARTVENDPRDRNPRLSRLLQCQNVTIAEFADQLMALSPNDFAYSVVDATGITGRWDFMLNYAPTGDRRIPVGAREQDADPSGAATIFESINKQLGVKLELRKRMLPVLVIDHIEEKPTEN